MKHYHVSFLVVYDDVVEAETPEEAADIAMDNCQYDVEGNSGAYVVCEETGEEFDLR